VSHIAGATVLLALLSHKLDTCSGGHAVPSTLLLFTSS